MKQPVIYSIRDYKEIMETCIITLKMTERCNNKCWYCNGGFNYTRQHYDEWNAMDFLKLRNFIDAQEAKNIRIQFLGGEPTLSPLLRSWIKSLRWNYRDKLLINVTSNLIRSLDYFRTLELDNRVKFTCSFHSDHIKDVVYWFDKVKYLKSKGALEKVFLMLQGHQNIDLIRNIYDRYKNKFKLEVYPIDQFYYNTNYDEYAKKYGFESFNAHRDSLFEDELSPENVKVILEDGTNDYKNFDQYMNFFGMMCNSGFVINPNGDVLWCLLMDEPILNIKTDEIKKIFKWHVCTRNICKCDFLFQKYSMEEWKKIKPFHR